MEFSALLEKIVRDPTAEAEWIDLLSQLEYVGCRKIVKSVSFDRVDCEVLRHIAEEASHAYLLKSLVPRPDWKGARFSELGWRYFQSLDQSVSALQPASGPYPAVSWAVEQRVMRVYPLYLRMTEKPDVQEVLARILAQEKRHHDAFAAVPFSPELRAQIRAVEEASWKDFTADLETVLCEISELPALRCAEDLL